MEASGRAYLRAIATAIAMAADAAEPVPAS
jgi:hypothetical protein